MNKERVLQDYLPRVPSREQLGKIDKKNKYTERYYREISEFTEIGAITESTVETSFKNLLKDVGEHFEQKLIKESIKGTKERNIIPDGLLVDSFRMIRGIWEAKDESDNLEDEIKQKRSAGYPFKNIIFENTRQISLYQNNAVEFDGIDMQNRDHLLDLLYAFFTYIEPDIDDFYRAVDRFKKEIPDLADALRKIIEDKSKNDPEFKKELDRFVRKNIRVSSRDMSVNEVKDLLIQHLLTERLFLSVFKNDEFVSKNTIAREVDKLVLILSRKAFTKKEFFKSMDHFYKAIERTTSEFNTFFERQQFLNEIYQLFFSKYSPGDADRFGIVYTPLEIVKFMTYYTNEILKDFFEKSLSSKGVNIIDPCVGTGTFILEILNHIEKTMLKHKYKEEIYCNDIMLLPYYIASANIEYAYHTLTGTYLKYQNIAHADSLELIKEDDDKRNLVEIFSENINKDLPPNNLHSYLKENVNVAERQLKTPFFVIIGNPPYSATQRGENLNISMKHDYIDRRIGETYTSSDYSKVRLRNSAYDSYLKFIRWATDKLGNNDGIVCFITNNSFVHNRSFDGMRRCLFKDFSRIYHLDLGGYYGENSKMGGSGRNVFDIRLRVGITFFIKSKEFKDSKMFYSKIDDMLKKDGKLAELDRLIQERVPFTSIFTEEVTLNEDGYLNLPSASGVNQFPEGSISLFDENGSKEGIYLEKYPGISTGRNPWVYNFPDKVDQLEIKVEEMIQYYNFQVDFIRGKRRRKELSGNYIDLRNHINELIPKDPRIKWNRHLIRNLHREKYAEKFNKGNIVSSCYRPGIIQILYNDKMFIDSPSKHQSSVFKNNFENVILLISGKGSNHFSSFATSLYPDYDTLSKTQTFPLSVFDEKKKEFKENISNYSLVKFKEKVNIEITKKDILNYVYGILNHPGYVKKYEQNLRRSFPRIPISPDFNKISELGGELLDLHLSIENIELYDAIEVEEINNGRPVVFDIVKMKLDKRNRILKYNKQFNLKNIPEECFQYEINGKSFLGWVIKIYENIKVEDDRIINLIKKRISLSVKSVRLIQQIGKLEFEE